MSSNVVLKYCELIDEFVKIRVMTEAEIRDLLHVARVPGKAAYRQLVVNACVADFNEAVLGATEGRGGRGISQREKIEEAVYALCVEVNPKFDIHQVTIPMVGREATREPIPLIGDETAQAPAAQPRRAPIDRSKVESLRERLSSQVVGQDAAVMAVSRAVQKAVIGLRDPRKPIGSFLFVGKTGVGKTELARALAASLYGGESRLVRIDCSEYSQQHEYSKLLGAPPGYIGHNEGGLLTSRVAEHGACVVLLDEIEKAHPKVHTLLLQVMEEGCLTDGKGERVSFSDSVVVLTSNLGSDSIEKWQNRMGFDFNRRAGSDGAVASEAALKAVKQSFPPEFVNRLDEVVVFNPLGRKDCLLIVQKMLAELADYARQSDVSLQFTRRLREALVRLGYSEEYGARELRRAIQKVVEDPLADRMIDGRIQSGRLVRVDFKDGEARFAAP